jgi:hypothetical protein
MTQSTDSPYAMYPYATSCGRKLDDLLADFRPAGYGEAFEDWDSFFTTDYSELWRKIVADETIGQRAISALSLNELADLALAYGRHLVPVPYLELVYAERWAPKTGAPGALVAFPRHDGTAIVRSRERGRVNILKEAGADTTITGTIADRFPLGDFAAALPMGLVDVGTRLPTAVANELMTLALAETLGAAEGAFAKSLSWALQRMVFGHVLGSYQAIKHLLADVFMSLEMLRSAVEGGLHGSLSTGSADRAFEYALEALEGCVQVHGGRGFAWDGGVAPRMRHVLGLRVLVSGLSLEEAA